jgi:N-terminal domain of anti-restriction factor ArdC
MKIEQANQIARTAIEQLSRALEMGRSEMLNNYLRAMSQFHRYSLRNIILISTQNPAASCVAGYQAWRAIGRFVKKGEQGIIILAPIVPAKDSRNGAAAKTESSTPVAFRPAYVFDISQTDGKEIPQIGRVTGNPIEQRARLEKFTADQGIVLEY